MAKEKQVGVSSELEGKTEAYCSLCTCQEQSISPTCTRPLYILFLDDRLPPPPPQVLETEHETIYNLVFLSEAYKAHIAKTKTCYHERPSSRS